MVLATFAEVASIGAVLPFLGALLVPEKIFAHPMIQPLITRLELTEPAQVLLPLTGIFIFTAFVSGLIRILLNWAQTQLGFAIGADISLEIYRKSLYQPYLFHVSRNSSDLITAITSKTDSVVGSVIVPGLVAGSSALILLSILLTLVLLNPQIVFITFTSFGVLYGLIALCTRKLLERDSEQISLESNNARRALQEGLGGIRDVLVDGTQEVFCRIYQKADLLARRSQANVQVIANAPRFFIESIGMSFIAILAYFLATRGDGLVVAIPFLGAVAIGAQRLLPILQQLYASLSNIQGNKGSLKDVLFLLDQPLPEYPQNSLALPLPFRRSIRLKRVGFQYTQRSPWVLRGLDLEIFKGSRIGIIGTTGGGKSTVLDLIMALLRPTEGEILVDDLPISVENQRAWQLHIAHVPQNIFLADTTIAENIAFGIPSTMIDFSRVRAAAHKAQIGSTIESWEKQYETAVGERGALLSGGQRQRIGIARAIYKNADVVVLDEATSALDNNTETMVIDAISSMNKEVTIIMVAHRLTSLKTCNQIIELERGRIKSIGPYVG